MDVESLRDNWSLGDAISRVAYPLVKRQPQYAEFSDEQFPHVPILRHLPIAIAIPPQECPLSRDLIHAQFQSIAHHAPRMFLLGTLFAISMTSIAQQKWR